MTEKSTAELTRTCLPAFCARRPSSQDILVLCERCRASSHSKKYLTVGSKNVPGTSEILRRLKLFSSHFVMARTGRAAQTLHSLQAPRAHGHGQVLISLRNPSVTYCSKRIYTACDIRVFEPRSHPSKSLYLVFADRRCPLRPPKPQRHEDGFAEAEFTGQGLFCPKLQQESQWLQNHNNVVAETSTACAFLPQARHSMKWGNGANEGPQFGA